MNTRSITKTARYCLIVVSELLYHSLAKTESDTPQDIILMRSFTTLAVMEGVEMRLLALTWPQPLNFACSIEPKNWKIL